MSLEERLNEIIEAKDSLISSLEEKLATIEFQKDIDNRKWMLHSAFVEDAFYKQLPYPRIEMRFDKEGDNWYNHTWTYGIVYKAYWDTNTELMYFVPLGKTSGSGGGLQFEDQAKDGILPLPFRDGVHMQADAFNLQLPAYITCKEKFIYQSVIPDIVFVDNFNKMRRSNTTDRDNS